MAGAGVNLGNFGLLQLDYEDLIVEMLASGVGMFKYPVQTDWQGDLIDFRVRTAKNPGMGFTEDGGAYAPAGKQSYATVRIGRRFFGMKLMITQGVLAAAASDKNSFRSAVASETSGALKDQMDFYNKIGFLDGTGKVATVVSAGSASTVNVDQGALLWPGGKLEWRDSAGTTIRGLVTVVSVNNALSATGGNVVFTVDALPSGATGTDTLYWHDGAQSSYGRAIAGLDNLINDATGTFQNVSVTNNPQYTSYVNSASANRPLTPLILRQTLAAVVQKAGNDGSDRTIKTFGSAWQLLEFEQMFEGAYRLVDPADGKVGYKGRVFDSALGRIELERDTDTPRGYLFGADMSQIKLCQQKRVGFQQEPGGGIWRGSHDGQFATAVMNGILQMRIDDRKTSFKIKNLTDAATFSL